MLSKPEIRSAVAACNSRFPRPSSGQCQGFKDGLNLSGCRFESREEVAMFMAQVIHESGGLQFKEEIDRTPGRYLIGANGPYYNPNKSYHGRGYMQLSHPCNYNDASEALFGDARRLMNNPDEVARDERVAWATAMWFWKDRVQPKLRARRNQGRQDRFEATTTVINGGVESDMNDPRRRTRRGYFAAICSSFGI